MTALGQVARQRDGGVGERLRQAARVEGTTVMDSYHMSGNGQVQVSLMLLGSGPAALGTEQTLKTWERAERVNLTGGTYGFADAGGAGFYGRM